MDLYALQANDSVHIAPMNAKTMNEAPEYGSSFSRGMTVAHNGWTTAYVSGTASINDHGEVVHIGDIEGQAHRMFQNIEALLSAQGASLNDIVSAITYLKHPEFLAPFNRVAQMRGLPANVPNTITLADVCRPEWLCEIEVIAIFPNCA